MQTFVKIEMDDDIESTSEEVDALFDYMDERVEKDRSQRKSWLQSLLYLLYCQMKQAIQKRCTKR